MSTKVLGNSPGEDFVARINILGEENILGFGFDNAGRKIFMDPKKKFSLAEHYRDDLEALVFEETDNKMNVYKVIKPVDMIQTIFVCDPSLIGKISSREIL